MTEGAFIKAILADPEDDAPRLIFADWLDEQGQCERAEFIKVQIALARLGGYNARACETACRCSSCEVARPLIRRERELWDIGTNGGGFLEVPGYFGVHCWVRGFVKAVRLPAEWWLAHGDAILEAQPVEEVALTTGVPAEWCWGRVSGLPTWGGVEAALKIRWRQIKKWRQPVTFEMPVTFEDFPIHTTAAPLPDWWRLGDNPNA